MNNLGSYQPKKTNPVAVAAIIFLALLAIVGVGLGAARLSGQSKSEHPSSLAAAATSSRAPAKAFFDDMYGQFMVGDGVGKIPAGTYQVTVTPGKGGGYWERCSDLECRIAFGPEDSVISNKYLASGSAYLVIKPTDVSVKIEDLTLERVK